MKFYLSSIVGLLMIASAANAQHVNFGIKAGLNIYNIHNDEAVGIDSKAGLHLGLLAHIHFTEHFAVQPEVVYSGQGAKDSDPGFETNLSLDYLNIPIMVQYMFGNGFRIQAGPQIGFLLGAKVKAGGQSQDIKDETESIDFSLGAGVSYIHVPSGFGFDIRYNLGLSDISKEDNQDVTNRGFQIGVFYLFKHS